MPGLHAPPPAGEKGKQDGIGLDSTGGDGGGEGLPLPIPPPTTSDAFVSLPEDNLSHRPLASYRSGEIFTQDVRPEQLLEGKVSFPQEIHIRTWHKVDGFHVHLDLALGEGGTGQRASSFLS